MPPAPADALRRVRIAGSELPALAWSEGLEVSLPAAWLTAGGLDGAVDRQGVLRIPATATLPPTAPRDLRLRAAFTPQPPVSSRLPVSYRAVPGPVRRVLARGIGRWHRSREARWAAFPGWPLDLSADFAADLARPSTVAPAATPIVLSHDLDSPEGLRNLVERFLPLEEAVGARSTNFVVPRAWPLDDTLLAETHRRGHELGIHGFDHANRTPFAPPDERRARLRAGRALADRFDMSGYRAPSLLRTAELLDDLQALYRYDSSIPTSGGPFPVPNNGCATARPFRIGSIVEIPVSLPRDGSLQFLGYGPAAILALWRQCADRIARARGVVVLLTHCEAHFSGNAAMLDVYRGFLEWAAGDGRFVWARAGDVAAGVGRD